VDEVIYPHRQFVTKSYTTDFFKELVKTAGKADCIVSYPQDLILSEMTKPEKKKYLSGKLL